MPAPINIDVRADASQARREISGLADTTEKSTGRLRSMVGKTAKVVALGLGAGLLGAAAAAKTFASAAIEDERGAARLEQTLTKVTGATKSQVAATEDWITKQGKALGVADDDLRPALARLVTSTKDVGEAQKLSGLAMDVSAATGKSLESVSTALMKANNGQVSSLSRLGINTKNAAGETVSMAEATKRMQETFGGAAAKNADTLGGRVDRLKLLLSETGETIGAKMLPTLTTWATYLLTTAVPAVLEIGGKVAEWASNMRDQLAPTVQAIGGFITGTMVPAFVNLATTLNNNRDIILAVAAGLAAGYTVLTVYNTITRVVAASTAAWNVVQKLLNGSMRANPIGLVVTAVGLLVAGLVIAYKRSDTFREIVNKVASVVRDTVLPVLGRFVSSVGGAIVTAVQTAIGIIGTIIGKVVAFGGALVEGVRDIGAFARGVAGKISEVVGFFTSLPGKIRGALSGAGEWLVQTGKNIINGLVAGLSAAKQWVIDKIKEIADVIPDWIARKLGIASPSKVTTKQGLQTGQGLARGIGNSIPLVSAAARGLAAAAIEAIERKMSAATSLRDSIVSMTGSLRDTLTGSLFGDTGDDDASALDKFRAGLDKAKATALKVRDAVAAMSGKVSTQFLDKLVSSGNSELIVQLAGAPDIASLSASYDAVIAQNEETGRAVAEQVIGARLDDVNGNLLALANQLMIQQENEKAERAAEKAREKADRAAEREQDKADAKAERAKGLKLEVEVSSDGVDQLTRGKRIKQDVKAYENAGGR